MVVRISCSDSYTLLEYEVIRCGYDDSVWTSYNNGSWVTANITDDDIKCVSNILGFGHWFATRRDSTR